MDKFFTNYLRSCEALPKSSGFKIPLKVDKKNLRSHLYIKYSREESLKSSMAKVMGSIG